MADTSTDIVKATANYLEEVAWGDLDCGVPIVEADMLRALAAERDALAAQVKALSEPQTRDEALTEILRLGQEMDAYADAIAKAVAEEREKWVKVVVECRDEIDSYIRLEYPSDHPVHQRYRQRDYEANPARIALAAICTEGE